MVSSTTRRRSLWNHHLSDRLMFLPPPLSSSMKQPLTDRGVNSIYVTRTLDLSRLGICHSILCPSGRESNQITTRLVANSSPPRRLCCVYGGDFAGKRDIVTRDRLTKDPSPHHYFAADHRQTVSNMLVPNWKRRMSSSSSSQPTHFGHRKLVRSQETISSGFQNLVTSRRTVSKATNSKPEPPIVANP